MYGHGAKIIRVVPDPVANPLSQKQDSGPRRQEEPERRSPRHGQAGRGVGKHGDQRAFRVEK